MQQFPKKDDKEGLTKYKDLLRPFINRFFNKPIVKSLLLKNPRISKFFFNRISLNAFNGLPLTLLIVAFGANLMAFNELAESIENSPWMLSIDNSFAKFLYKIRINEAALLFFYFSKAGSMPVVIAVALIIMLILFFNKRLIYTASVLLTLFGTGTTVYLGKHYFHRIRPDGFNFYNETSYSFPSGHSVIAVAFYGLLFYLLARETSKYKMGVILGSLLFILLLGFSRLYLGVHFLSDVLAGYSLGFLWLLLAISIIEWKKD